MCEVFLSFLAAKAWQQTFRHQFEHLAATLTELDEACQAAGGARERTAELCGRTEVIKEQNRHLLQTLKLGAQK